MSALSILLAVLLILSLGLNAYLYRSKPGAAKAAAAGDAGALLRDLLGHGQALVHVRRVAPEDVLLRSPRGRP